MRERTSCSNAALRLRCAFQKSSSGMRSTPCCHCASVMACFDRRMRSEYRVARHGFQRAGEIDTAVHDAAHALEHEECRVALIHVPDRGLEPHRGESARSADAKHDLLFDARALVAA